MNCTLSHFFRTLLVVTAGTTAVAFGQPLQQASPFMPVAGPAAAGPASAKYQLGGMIANGKDILVSITRVSDKQSFWVPVGGTVNEVTVLTYDPDEDRASIRANGEQITLTMRKAVVVNGGNSASVTAVAGAPTPTPPLPSPTGSPEVQEREARMLVTDLLEIGQQHRKAYEEAQRRAAAEKKK